MNKARAQRRDTGRPSNQLVGFQEKVADMRHVLEKGRGELERILPKYMSADAMLRITLTAMQRTPKLLDCAPNSVGLALMNAAALGLEPNGRDGHLIPYKNTCQFIPDYKGIVKLIYENDRVASVEAEAIRANDEFDYRDGSDGYLHHRKPLNVETVEDRGELIGAYALIWLQGSDRPVWQVLSKGEVLKVRDSSQGYRSAKQYNKESIWDTWPDPMWAKTALKALSKFAPVGRQAERAAMYDDTIEAKGMASMQDVAPEMQIENPYGPGGEAEIDEKVEETVKSIEQQTERTSPIDEPIDQQLAREREQPQEIPVQRDAPQRPRESPQEQPIPISEAQAVLIHQCVTRAELYALQRKWPLMAQSGEISSEDYKGLNRMANEAKGELP